MINFKKAEWAENMKITLKDGSQKICKGNGISLAEDFEDKNEQYDTLFIIEGNKRITLNIEDIESIDFYE